MPIVEITARDINRSKVVTPAWYRVRIEGVGEAPSKAGDSTNYTIDGTILFNAEDKTTTFADVPTPYWNFNTKAKGFMVPFFEALGGTVEPGSRFDFNNAIGKEIDVFIENKDFEGRMVNNLNHKYRAPRA